MNRRLFYDHLSACAVRVTSNNKLPSLRLSDALPLEGEVGWDMRSVNLEFSIRSHRVRQGGLWLL